MNRRDFLKYMAGAGIATAGSLFIPGAYRLSKAGVSVKGTDDYLSEFIEKGELGNIDSRMTQIILKKYSEKISPRVSPEKIRKYLSSKEDPLTKKIIEIESSARNHIIGDSLDIGLMQITPIVLEEYNMHNKKEKFIDLFEPETNIKIGKWYLHERIGNHYIPHNKLHPTEENKAAFYNAGPTKMSKIGDAIENFNNLPEKTQNYLIKLWNIS